jgi:dipeptidyl-peptidase-3
MPSLDAGKAQYDKYIENGLMIQLTRLPEVENQLEESHMRNRQMIAAWVYEHGKNDNVIAKVVKEGKTYFEIRDYEKLRSLFGQLLREVQRIKSEGDYKAGSGLVENYGVKVDPELHKEILNRYAKLNIAPYRGFIQPHLEPVMDKTGEISNVRIVYPQKFMMQMMNFGRKYSFLPVEN